MHIKVEIIFLIATVFLQHHQKDHFEHELHKKCRIHGLHNINKIYEKIFKKIGKTNFDVYCLLHIFLIHYDCLKF